MIDRWILDRHMGVREIAVAGVVVSNQFSVSSYSVHYHNITGEQMDKTTGQTTLHFAATTILSTLDSLLTSSNSVELDTGETSTVRPL